MYSVITSTGRLSAQFPRYVRYFQIQLSLSNASYPRPPGEHEREEEAKHSHTDNASSRPEASVRRAPAPQTLKHQEARQTRAGATHRPAGPGFRGAQRFPLGTSLSYKELNASGRRLRHDTGRKGAPRSAEGGEAPLAPRGPSPSRRRASPPCARGTPSRRRRG